MCIRDRLDRTVVVSKGKLNQAQLEEYQSDAIALYQQKEPQGKILSISPNTDTSALLITVDSIQKSTLKAFKKKFHDNVFLQLPPAVSYTHLIPYMHKYVSS